MLESYLFDIGTLLADSRPDSILSIGPDPQAPIADYLEQRAFLRRPCRVTTLLPNQVAAGLDTVDRFELGIVLDTLEHLDKEQGVHLIARLRDVHTARFCVVANLDAPKSDTTARWTAEDFVGLGMVLVNRYEHGRHMYKYDIATYKATPDWLNPSDWANPELWDKYRW